jgi:hypothetical protein
MLISMPTGTSTIFGVFQAIGVSSLYCIVARTLRSDNLRAGQLLRKRNRHGV